MLVTYFDALLQALQNLLSVFRWRKESFILLFNQKNPMFIFDKRGSLSKQQPSTPPCSLPASPPPLIPSSPHHPAQTEGNAEVHGGAPGVQRAGSDRGVSPRHKA
ncbi:hypothetical protein EYF80_011790 [Liparis tanakae]|uniref:Uncharacterized protein n=1 Tax=Liparis tanakae TaxID=230148 RepID=A0A4Z2IJI3_9TELE|nr:hypothetical protein EYF80_011790 [Liparis tanakae]